MTLMLIQRRHKGFTIVELMVVMIGIGLLLTVSVFAYGAWRTSVAKTEVMNDLKNVAAAMKNARNFDNVYPTLTPGSTPRGKPKVIRLKSWCHRDLLFRG